MSPRPTVERIWIGYLVVVVVIAVACRDDLPAGAFVSHLLTHAAVGVAVVMTSLVARRRSHAAARWPRVAVAILGLPVVFSAMAWLLPAVHPEPYEFSFVLLERTWCGGDPAALAHRWLSPALVEVMQLTYACFYLLPIVAALAVLRRAGAAAFDRAVLMLVGGFLASYLGYLLVPTLAPKVVLAYEQPLRGLWIADPLRRAIDASEANPWDCFPSGHTWLSLTSLSITWRWNRRAFAVLLVPAVVLIASTVLLRYHWVVDVVAGALLAWPCARLCDWLADRDGWPRPGAADVVTPA